MHLRRLFVVLALVATSATAAAEAPAEDPPRNAISLSASSLALGIWRLEYERAFGDHLSVYVAPTYWSLNFADLGFLGEVLGWEGVTIRSLGAGAGVRLFLAGPAPEGFWISPGFEWHQIRGTYRGARADSPGWAVGGQLGYTFLLGDVFHLSIGAGADYNKRELTFTWREAGAEEMELKGYEGVLPTARLSLGAAF